MERTFRPQKSIIVTVIVTWYTLAAAFFFIFIYAGNPIQTLTIPFIVISILFSIFPVLFLFTRIVLTEDTISLVFIPPFRKTTKIAEIESVSYRSRLAGDIDAYLIKYHWKWGIHLTIGITINAYGAEMIKEILIILRQKNPRIKFDRQTEKLLSK